MVDPAKDTFAAAEIAQSRNTAQLGAGTEGDHQFGFAAQELDQAPRVERRECRIANMPSIYFAPVRGPQWLSSTVVRNRQHLVF